MSKCPYSLLTPKVDSFNNMCVSYVGQIAARILSTPSIAFFRKFQRALRKNFCAIPIVFVANISATFS